MQKLLKIEQVAELYGFAKRSVYDWVKRKTLTHIRLGGRIYIRPEDVEEMIRKNVIKAKK